MGKYIVNATVGEFAQGEVVELNPALFADLIEGKYLVPIDDDGNRLDENGDILVLHSTQYEQSQPAAERSGSSIEMPTQQSATASDDASLAEPE